MDKTSFRRSIPFLLALAATTPSVACGDGREPGGPIGATSGAEASSSVSGTSGASEGSNTGAEESGGEGDPATSGSPGSGSGQESGTSGGESSGSGGSLRLDVGPGGMSGSGGEAGGMGCQKVDFLFVVDNSMSMLDEQQNLTNNFPRFMDVIQNTLDARDYHVMAVDSDANGGMTGNSTCSKFNGVGGCTCDYPACCLKICADPQWMECNGAPCDPMGPCNGLLGAGRTYSSAGDSCNIQGGNRYLLDQQPDLAGTFACVAKVGSFGDGDEQPMAAMVDATGPALNGPGGCNAGFVRDDAILVVTFITDEEDGLPMKSPGDPASWRQALIDAKHGDEEAIVVLGLIGDGQVVGGLPGGPCTGGAAPSPILQSFVEQFTYGHLGSICATDYAQFFTDAVSFIDTACDTFVPPG